MVTDPLEDNIKNISGVNKVTSSSFQDYGMIVAEFDDDITVDQAKILIKDKVDVSKADTDWPTLDNGSKVEPNVSASILQKRFLSKYQLKGDYTAQQLKNTENILKMKSKTFLKLRQ